MANERKDALKFIVTYNVAGGPHCECPYWGIDETAVRSRWALYYQNLAIVSVKTATGDGIALRSMPHPTAPWWRRILFWFQRVRLSEDAIENAEIEIDPSKKSGGFRINRPKV